MTLIFLQYSILHRYETPWYMIEAIGRGILLSAWLFPRPCYSLQFLRLHQILWYSHQPG